MTFSTTSPDKWACAHIQPQQQHFNSSQFQEIKFSINKHVNSKKSNVLTPLCLPCHKEIIIIINKRLLWYSVIKFQNLKEYVSYKLEVQNMSYKSNLSQVIKYFINKHEWEQKKDFNKSTRNINFYDWGFKGTSHKYKTKWNMYTYQNGICIHISFSYFGSSWQSFLHHFFLSLFSHRVLWMLSCTLFIKKSWIVITHL